MSASVAEKITSAIMGVFGSRNERVVRKLVPVVQRILDLGPSFRRLTDAALRGKTDEFRNRLKNGEALGDLLPEAFAAVKEACRRMVGHSWEAGGTVIEWNMVPFDVQLMGGIVLHQGKIAEMVTGEGKTLVATLPSYLNALTGKGVHIVTVNDYLARRDREWMAPIFGFLGLNSAAIQHDMSNEDRKKAYACDITYGTNSEFGFDYLRDNMKFDINDYVQRDLNYAIVDEVDSILIDEARTPLIISGAVEKEEHHYDEYKHVVRALVSAQKRIVEKMLDEALATEGFDDRLYRLLQVRRGDPKSKRLSQYLTEEKGVLKELNRLEGLMHSERRTEELDKGLLYGMNERDHAVEFTEEGMDFLLDRDKDLKDIIVMPDLQTEADRIDGSDMDYAEKERQKARLSQEFFEKKDRRNAIDQLLRACALFERDVDYVVNRGEVIIVDEFTGRMMPGRRYSDGLHQALEAKENVQVAKATQTIATITLQNYFRMYTKLAGMTGTAATEAAEFFKIYKLDVVAVPTHRPLIRLDYQDLVYRTNEEKQRAIIEEIANVHRTGRPILVGTVSIEKSEVLSKRLTLRGVKHEVLNAKQHAREAHIVAKAGQLGNVVIATNMAGRGTDIVLGTFDPKDLLEHWKRWELAPKDLKVNVPCEELEPELLRHWAGVFLEGDWSSKGDGEIRKALEKVWREMGMASLAPGGSVADLGGLHIVGTERHEARRIDNQLRGRAGRQGDPGSSRFFLSLEDDLMRIFGSDSVSSVLERLGMEKDQAIQSGLVSRSIARAQRRVEENNFAIRKRLLEYDEVMDQQRKVVYGLRRDILMNQGVRDIIMEMITASLSRAFAEHAPDNDLQAAWNPAQLCQWCIAKFGIRVKPGDLQGMGEDAVRDSIVREIEKRYGERESAMGKESMASLERFLLLRAIDTRWKDHLYDMDMLRSEISWRSLAQIDPTVAYKKEGFEMFQEMMQGIDEEVAGEVLVVGGELASAKELAHLWDVAGMVHDEFGSYRQQQEADLEAAEAAGSGEKMQPIRSTGPKTGRNEPCPCGSGKKYKKCCGK